LEEAVVRHDDDDDDDDVMMWLATVFFVGTESWLQSRVGELADRRPIKTR
jgi:hypothetical protein